MKPHPDRALLLQVPSAWAEVVGALLLDEFGPFEERDEGARTALLFYPERIGVAVPSPGDVLGLLPDDPELTASVGVTVVEVAAGWEDNWRNFFVPLDIGRFHVRPPWEVAAQPSVFDVCINPGLAFGTGFHETTRGVLWLLQEEPGAVCASGDTGSSGPGSSGRAGAARMAAAASTAGPLIDAGCGSGILSIAARRLGYDPVRAFDADPLAVEATAANSAANNVEVEVVLATVASVDLSWFEGTTVVANIAEGPVLELLDRLATAWPGEGEGADRGPRRLIASGLLHGEQEQAVRERATECGWQVVRDYREGEWVSLDLCRG